VALFTAIAAIKGVASVVKRINKVRSKSKANLRQALLAGGAQVQGSPTIGGTFATGADIEIIADTEFDLDPLTGEITPKKRRRRRRRMLTCADRADIAFVVGILGKGQAGSSAVTQLMSRCN